MVTETNEPTLPLPTNWAKIHQQLERVRVARGGNLPEVPVPLILAGAAFSTANSIRERWRETLDWARRHECMSELMAVYVAPPDGRDIAEELAGVSESGRGWWPDTTFWNSQPRPRPSREQLTLALETLQTGWAHIAGTELAAHTRPLAITGNKKRRLLVAADPDYSPEWGHWDSFAAKPAAFRNLRLCVNSAIAPVEVDHIEFEGHMSAPSWREER